MQSPDGRGQWHHSQSVCTCSVWREVWAQIDPDRKQTPGSHHDLVLYPTIPSSSNLLVLAKIRPPIQKTPPPNKKKQKNNNVVLSVSFHCPYNEEHLMASPLRTWRVESGTDLTDRYGRLLSVALASLVPSSLRLARKVKRCDPARLHDHFTSADLF